MIVSAWKAFWRQFGFYRKTAQVGFLPGSDNWAEAQFYTEEKRRNERLAAIASEISALNVKRLKAKKQSKNQKVFEDQMTALMAERLRIEAGEEVSQ